MVQHVGMGVARRAAEHLRQHTEREAEEAASDEPDDAERVPVAAEEVLAGIALCRHPQMEAYGNRPGHAKREGWCKMKV